MRVGSTVRHSKYGFLGTIMEMGDDHAYIVWSNPGMYNIEYHLLTHLELVEENDE